MQKVQLRGGRPALTRAVGAAAVGAAAPILLLVELVLGAGGSRLGAWGWIAAIGYLAVSNALLVRGLRRSGANRVGPANLVTSLRSTLVAAITGLVAADLAGSLAGGATANGIPIPLLLGLVVPALALDGVDGWVARRSGSASELGARFDMEVDAFLLLVLSAHAARGLGPWVLGIGLLRYAFVAAGWIWPRLRRTLPYRYWRKVAAAFAGVALAFAASGLLPGLSAALVALALLLLVESFGRDLVWLLRSR